MKTEISRDSYKRKKRYSGVYQQQGRMLTDADWNELVEILKERLKESLKDVVGSKEGSAGGIPHHRALKIVNNGDGATFKIRPGQIYVNGIAAEFPGDTETNYENQVDFPSTPSLPSSNNYILYADVWERTVTHLFDEQLRDKGLHGADTCTRTQPMVQVKACLDTIDPEQPEQNPTKGNAELTVTLLEKTMKPDLCDPCVSELDIESRIGNYLLRVEVHDVKGDVNNPTEITLKWSSENGAEQFKALAKEEMPVGFFGNKFVYELFSETSEKQLGAHFVTDNKCPLRKNLFREENYPVQVTAGFDFVRRWDGYAVFRKDAVSKEWELKKGYSELGDLKEDSSSTRFEKVLKLNSVELKQQLLNRIVGAPVSPDSLVASSLNINDVDIGAANPSAADKANAINSASASITAIAYTVVEGVAPTQKGEIRAGQLKIDNKDIVLTAVQGSVEDQVESLANVITAAFELDDSVDVQISLEGAIRLTVTDGRNIAVDVHDDDISKRCGFKTGVHYGHITIYSPDNSPIKIAGDNPEFAGFNAGITPPVQFVAGDFWLAEVREIEHKDGSQLIKAQPPQGIEHHYLKLAEVIGDVLQENQEADRKFSFPPLTEMTHMFHIGGDGQEAMPDHLLAQPLTVGVTNGEWPVAGAKVEFRITRGEGQLEAHPEFSPLDNFDVVNQSGEAITDEKGVVKCCWRLGTDASTTYQNGIEQTGQDYLNSIPILGTSTSGDLTGFSGLDLSSEKDAAKRSLTVSIDGTSPVTFDMGAAKYQTLEEISDKINDSTTGFVGLSCAVVRNTLVLTSGTRTLISAVVVTPGLGVAQTLKLGIGKGGAEQTGQEYFNSISILGMSTSGDLTGFSGLDLSSETDAAERSFTVSIDGASPVDFDLGVTNFQTLEEISNTINDSTAGLIGLSCAVVNNRLILTSDSHTTASAVVVDSKSGVAPGLKLGDSRRKQGVVVRLLNPSYDNSVSESKKYLDHPPIHFYANVSTADQVAYVNPVCIDTPSVNSLLHRDSNRNGGFSWPDLDKDGDITVKDILDVFLCKLKAKHIPYDATLKPLRWEDINEEDEHGNPLKPNTVQDALDNIVDNLESSDIKYRFLDSCSETPYGVKSLNSYIREDLGKTSPNSTTKIEDLWDKLLCLLDAKHIPYDATQKPLRWEDINELDENGNPLKPNTVQEALDDIVDNLESSDVRYTLPECDDNDYGVPTVKNYIEDVIPANKKHIDGTKVTTKIEDLWNAVLCYLDASRLPYNPRIKTERWKDIKEVTDLELVWTERNELPGTPSEGKLIWDHDGNLIAAFSSTVWTESKYQYHTVLLKLDSQGSLLGKEYIDGLLVNGLGIQQDGAIVIAGTFKGEVDLGGTAGKLKAAGENDLCVAKFDSSGRALWANSYGTIGEERLGCMLLDSNDAIYLSGIFTKTINLGGLDLVSEADKDIFVAKLDSKGSHVWSNRYAPSGSVKRPRLLVDPSDNNLIIAGSFSGTLKFGGSVLTSAGTTNAFLAKLQHTSGDPLWSYHYDGDHCDVFDLAVDNENNLLLSGCYKGTINFDGNALPTTASESGFIAKFNDDGSNITNLWSNDFASTAESCILSLATDSSNNIVYGGFFSGAIHVGDNEMTASGKSDALLGRMNSSGDHISAKRLDISEHLEGVISIVLDKKDNPMFSWLAETEAQSTICQVSKLTWDAQAAPNTVQAALDDLVEGLESSDIKYRFLDSCSETPYGVKSLNSYIREDLGKTSPNSTTKIEDLWDKLLCFLDAKRIPYDATQNLERWEDINELDENGNPLKPNTVQEALDNIVDNLESSDVRYTLPECDDNNYGAPTVKSYIEDVIPANKKHVDGSRITTKVEDLWNAVLCHLDAERIPYNPKTNDTRWQDIIDPGEVGSTFGEHLWSHNFQGTAHEAGQGIVVDSADNVLLTGYFTGTLDFGNNPMTAVGNDLFVAKFDAAGNHVWSHNFQGIAYEYGQGIAVDSAGNVLLTGYFTGMLDFGNNLMTAVGGRDLFVAKFDGAGNHVWSHNFQGTAHEYGKGIAVDSAGNVLLTGYFTGTLDFGNNPMTAVGNDLFVAKFDAAGNHVWSHNFQGTADEYGWDIAVDSAGNVLLTGSFTGTLDFGNNPMTAVGSNLFIVKFDGAGNHIWSRNFQGISRSIVVDSADNVILTGMFSGTLDFDNNPMTAVGSNLFIVKFDGAGNHIWSQNFQGTSEDTSWDIVVDSAGNVVLTGQFFGTLDFGNNPMTAVGGLDLFIAKFDGAGNHIWSRNFQGTASEQGRGIAVDSAGDVLLTGCFTGTLDFGNNPMTAVGNFDLFIAKLRGGQTLPVTIQSAIDTLAENLESSDINYRLPACAAMINCLRRRLPSLAGLDDDSTIKINELLNALVCELDASTIPYDRHTSDSSLIDGFVNKSGDTMTGQLIIDDGSQSVINHLLDVMGKAKIRGSIAVGYNDHGYGKLRLWSEVNDADNLVSHAIGTEVFHNTYGAGSGYVDSIGHKFYRGGGELIAQIGFGGSGKPGNRLDSHFQGSTKIRGSVTVNDNTHRSGKLRLWSEVSDADNLVSHAIGTEVYHNTYGAGSGYIDSIGHKFYRGGGELIAQIGFGGNNAPANRLDAQFSGRVGIGQAPLNEKLEVDGNVKASAFIGDGSQLTGISSGKWLDGVGGDIYYNTGNVGIGTTNPNYKLEVRGAGTYLGYFYNDNNGSGTTYGLNAEGDARDTASSQGIGARFCGRGSLKGAHAYGSISYAYAYGASNAYAVYADATYGTTTGREYAFYGRGDGYFSGNVGIGQAPAHEKLVVNGIVKASTLLTSGDLLAGPAGNRFIANSRGAVGINTTEKLSMLTVKGKGGGWRAGRVSVARNSLAVIGKGTAFLSEVGVGDSIYIETSPNSFWSGIVKSISDDTHLEITSGRSSNINGARYYIYSSLFRADTSSGETAFVISSSGRVGIGTSDPGSDKLDVRGRCYSSNGWQTTNADYAEYFESETNSEIPSGTSVALTKTGKIRPAKKEDNPIGIVASNSAIVGNSYKEWPGKYLRDEFGNLIMEEYQKELMVPKREKIKKERQKMETKTIEEEIARTEIVKEKRRYCQREVIETVTREVEEPVFKEVDLYDAEGKNKIGKHQVPVMETYEEETEVLDENGLSVLVGTGESVTESRPKLNPDYDESKQYTPREQRPEWSCVGLLGQLLLRKGQPVAPTWIKIKDVSDKVELWLVK